MKTLFLSLSLLCASPLAWALEDENAVFTKPYVAETKAEMKPHFGILIGPSIPNDNYDTAAAYGIDVGLQPVVPIGVAMQFTRMSSDRSIAPGFNEEVTQNRLLGKATYNFAGEIPVLRYSYAGIKAGPVFTKIGDSNHIFLGVAPVLGVDFPIDTRVTAGLDADYLFMTGSGNPNSFGINGSIKYWF